MKTLHKKARFLHDESREYRGLPRVRDYKTRANRIERRSAKQALASEAERVAKEEVL